MGTQAANSIWSVLFGAALALGCSGAADPAGGDAAPPVNADGAVASADGSAAPLDAGDSTLDGSVADGGGIAPVTDAGSGPSDGGGSMMMSDTGAPASDSGSGSSDAGTSGGDVLTPGSGPALEHPSSPPAGAVVIAPGGQHRDRDDESEVVYMEGDFRTSTFGGGSDTVYIGPFSDRVALAFDNDDGDVDRIVFRWDDLIAHAGGTDATLYGFEPGIDQIHIADVPSALSVVTAFTGTPFELFIDRSAFAGDFERVLIDADGDAMADVIIVIWDGIPTMVTADDIYI